MAEVKILGMLHHPNVVQVYDFGEADGTLFLVLEFVDGPSLGGRCACCAAPGGRCRSPSRPTSPREVCRALDYVHGLRGSDGEPLNVIHLDVTPSNVVVTPAVLLEAARFRHRQVRDLGGADPESLRSKASPPYLAPEVIEGGSFAPASTCSPSVSSCTSC